MRVGVIKDWDSRWYAREDKVGDLVVEDHKIREYLKKTLYSAGIPKIEIERDSAKVRIYIHCARPGVVIGRGGTEIERLRQVVEKMIGKPTALSIVEVRTPDTNAQLVAESIAQQLEKRIGFRRAMKNAMGRAMRMGVKGIKVMCSGRLGGAEIARSECYHEGTIPLQTIRADIEYGFAEAATTYGRIGVKVWIYKGEVLSQTLRSTPRTMDISRASENNRNDRRKSGRNDRDGGRDGGRGGYNRGPSTPGQGGYNRGPSTPGQGGYNRTPSTPGQGGYNRGPSTPGQGGYNRAPSTPGQGGYNRAPGSQTQSQGGYNHAPKAAAEPTQTEGGNN
jgi:small subunit ribosomal protein S3